MHRTARFALVLAFLVSAAAVSAQPRDGHVLLSVNTTLPQTRQFVGAIMVYDPTLDVFTTLLKTAPRFDTVDAFGVLSMASNNRDAMALGTGPGPGLTQTYRRVTTSGIVTTLAQSAANSIVGYVGGDLVLDGDGGWLVVGPRSRGLLRLDDPTWAVTTVFDLGPASTFQHFCSIAPAFSSQGEYWVLNWDQNHVLPPLLAVTRAGVVTTVIAGSTASPFDWTARIRSEPQTGAVWASRLASATQAGGAMLARRSRSGTVTTLVIGPGYRTLDLRIAQDGTLWALESRSNAVLFPPDVLHHLAPDGTSLSTRPIPGTGSSATAIGAAVSLELFGRRRLTVRGPGTPGSTASVLIASSRPADAGRPYLLACSLARGPGWRFASGEWLHLAFDPLFFLSASGAAPQIFQAFSGVLSAAGRAAATIQIPSTFPGGLDLPVFVAGVIYDRAGVQTVTNTHWLVLR